MIVRETPLLLFGDGLNVYSAAPLLSRCMLLMNQSLTKVPATSGYIMQHHVIYSLLIYQWTHKELFPGVA